MSGTSGGAASPSPMPGPGDRCRLEWTLAAEDDGAEKKARRGSQTSATQTVRRAESWEGRQIQSAGACAPRPQGRRVHPAASSRTSQRSRRRVHLGDRVYITEEVLETPPPLEARVWRATGKANDRCSFG